MKWHALSSIWFYKLKLNIGAYWRKKNYEIISNIKVGGIEIIRDRNVNGDLCFFFSLATCCWYHFDQCSLLQRLLLHDLMAVTTKALCICARGIIITLWNSNYKFSSRMNLHFAPCFAKHLASGTATYRNSKPLQFIKQNIIVDHKTRNWNVRHTQSIM